MTPPAPTRSTPAGRAYLDLRNLAKRDGRDSVEYFTLHALEGFLTRLADSQYAEDFAVKGGVLMAAFAARRPTRDIDLALDTWPRVASPMTSPTSSCGSGRSSPRPPAMASCSTLPRFPVHRSATKPHMREYASTWPRPSRR